MSKKLSRRSCSVLSCTNSWYTLEQWSKNICEKHKCNLGQASCVCPPPFKLFPFPTERKNPQGRLKWISLVNRKEGSANWIPTTESRICSKHFVDGEPSQMHPFPTLELGYLPFAEFKPARPAPRDRSDQIPRKKTKFEENTSLQSYNLNVNKENICGQSDHDDNYHVKRDHDYTCIPKCELCVNKSNEIKRLQNKIKDLTEQVDFYKKKYEIKTKKEFVVSTVLKDDKKCKYYTGIQTINSFNKTFKIITKKVKTINYWKGPKKTCNPLKTKKKVITQRERCLTRKDEFIMTLMKLRLGLTLEDLSDRFGISTAHASSIFTTWVKLLAKTLGAMVFNPPKEVVKSNLPPSFKNHKYSNVRHIIDCTEVFLETPNNPNLAYKTWSDYKSHHTAKFLLSINPSGLINFVSDCYGGRHSDKFITKNCGFMDMVQMYDTIMADKGFLIREDLALKGAELLIPPGRRGAAQMSSSDVRLTKQIANRRIHVEQAIKRIKSFRSLKFEVPLTLLPLLDDMIQTICAICNMYPPIPRYK